MRCEPRKFRCVPYNNTPRRSWCKGIASFRFTVELIGSCFQLITPAPPRSHPWWLHTKGRQNSLKLSIVDIKIFSLELVSRNSFVFAVRHTAVEARYFVTCIILYRKYVEARPFPKNLEVGVRNVAQNRELHPEEHQQPTPARDTKRSPIRLRRTIRQMRTAALRTTLNTRRHPGLLLQCGCS